MPKATKSTALSQHIYSLKTANTLAEYRNLALSPYGFVNSKIRKSIYSKILHIHAIELPPGTKSLDSTTKNQIELDVRRTFGTKFSAQDTLTLHSGLIALLDHFFTTFPYLNYYQGFHEIAAVLQLLFGCLRARAYLCVIGVVFLRDYLEDNMSTTLKHCQLVITIVNAADGHLGQHLTTIQDFNSFFTIPWILTWFSHVLDQERVLRLFDVFITRNPSFVIHLVAQILVNERQKLLECGDMSDILEILMKYHFKNLNWNELLIQADDSFRRDWSTTYMEILGPYSVITTFDGKNEI